METVKQEKNPFVDYETAVDFAPSSTALANRTGDGRHVGRNHERHLHLQLAQSSYGNTRKHITKTNVETKGLMTIGEYHYLYFADNI